MRLSSELAPRALVLHDFAISDSVGGMEGGEVKHTCHWTGCTREVPPAMWGCREHWFKLPKVLRDQIWKEYRPGQEIDKRPSDRYLATTALVQGWIAGKVEIRKDGSIFLKGDLQVGEHTLPVGNDGRLA